MHSQKPVMFGCVFTRCICVLKIKLSCRWFFYFCYTSGSVRSRKYSCPKHASIFDCHAPCTFSYTNSKNLSESVLLYLTEKNKGIKENVFFAADSSFCYSPIETKFREENVQYRSRSFSPRFCPGCADLCARILHNRTVSALNITCVWASARLKGQKWCVPISLPA